MRSRKITDAAAGGLGVFSMGDVESGIPFLLETIESIGE